MATDARLDGIELLRPLQPATRARLAGRCRFRRFSKSERIVWPDDPGRDMLFVVRGRVRVLTFAGNGREVAFAHVEAGSFVGELAAIDGRGRSAAVIADGPCEIAALPGAELEALILAEPEVALELLRHLAAIIRTADARIAELIALGSTQRVYRELLRLARPAAGSSDALVIEPLPTQQDIAARAGVTRETVARALGQLGTIGLAARRGRRLDIADRDGLERLATPEPED